MRVAIVAEYYPRAADPVLGVWAHRQAIAARDAGADVRVLVLHRPLPPLAALRRADLGARRAPRCASRAARRSTASRSTTCPTCRRRAPGATRPGARGPRRRCAARCAAARVVPVRPRACALRGARRRRRAARARGRAARRLRPRRRRARNRAAQRLRARAPSSARSRTRGSCSPTAPGSSGAAARSARTRRRSCTSAPTCPRDAAAGRRDAERAADARHRRPPRRAQAPRRRDRGARAARPPDTRRCATRSSATGPSAQRSKRSRRSAACASASTSPASCRPQRRATAPPNADLFVLPSVDEAFGVAYVEAMAAGVAGDRLRGEDGPDEIAAAGPGLVQVPPRDPRALADAIDRLLRDAGARARSARRRAATVERAFTWERCGEATVAAYERALDRSFLAARARVASRQGVPRPSAPRAGGRLQPRWPGRRGPSRSQAPAASAAMCRLPPAESNFRRDDPLRQADGERDRRPLLAFARSGPRRCASHHDPHDAHRLRAAARASGPPRPGRTPTDTASSRLPELAYRRAARQLPQTQLNHALHNLPGDVREYSGCSDAIGRRCSPSAAATTQRREPGRRQQRGGGTAAAADRAAAAAVRRRGAMRARTRLRPTPARPPVPNTPLDVAGTEVAPGALPEIGRDSHRLPTPLLVLLVLLGLAALDDRRSDDRAPCRRHRRAA